MKLIALLLALVAAAAAAEPKLTPEQVAAAKFPPKPDYQAIVRRHLRASLKDYDSAKFGSWQLWQAARATNPPEFGWHVSVFVNAKNMSGGYEGFQQLSFWIGASGKAEPISIHSRQQPQLIAPVEAVAEDGTIKTPPKKS